MNINDYKKFIEGKPTPAEVFADIARQESETISIYEMYSAYLEALGRLEEAKAINNDIIPEELKHACMALQRASEGTYIEDYRILKDD